MLKVDREAKGHIPPGSQTHRRSLRDVRCFHIQRPARKVICKTGEKRI